MIYGFKNIDKVNRKLHFEVPKSEWLTPGD